MSQPCYCLKHSRIFFYFLKRFYVCRFFIRATFSCHRLIVKLIGSNKSDHVTSIIEYHSASKENFCLLLMNQRLVGIFTCHSPVQPVFVVEPFVIPLLSHCDLETVFLKQQTLNLEILFLNIFYPKYFARFHQRHSVQMKTKMVMTLWMMRQDSSVLTILTSSILEKLLTKMLT